jgi:hypothetical protein
VDHLVRKQQALGWRYNARDLEPLPGGHDDLASTTLVAFALLAAHGRGVKVGAEVWERLLDFTLQLQDESGPEVRRPVLSGATNGLAPPVDHARGFAYSRILPDANEGRPSMGMTCCGVANLLMARYVLTETPVLKKRWDAGRLGKTTQVALDDGLAWLSLHWEPVPKAYLHYSHWMLEMCMGLAGRRLVGAHVWWDEIARSVVNRQAKDGDWESGTNHFDPSALDTCLALLVLSRSTKTELAMAGLENLRPAAR